MQGGIYRYFRRHYGGWFPALGVVHRTTFARQAANLWKVKEHLWQELLALTPHDRGFAICDSMPLAACLFARAYRCRRFRGEAAFGKDTLLKQTFYGFRVHVRVCWPGVITRISVAPAKSHELSVVPDLVEHTWGVVVGDRNHWSPRVREELVGRGVELAAPYRTKKRDPHPERSALLRAGFATGSTLSFRSSQSATPCPSSRRCGIEQGGSHEEIGSDGVRLALVARGESIGRKEVTEGRIDANFLV